MELFDLVQVVLSDLAQSKIPPVLATKMLISKLLSMLVVTGAAIVKLPQILALVRASSAEGLNVLSIELEMLGYFVHFSYGYLSKLPFSTYGEAALLLAQTVILLLLVLNYAKQPWWRGAIAMALLSVGGGAVYTGQVSVKQIQLAYRLNNLVFVASRVPQIVTNFNNRSTGQLSIITAFMNFGGSLARIFTSIQENVGSAMVQGYILGAVLNFTLFAQILLMGGSKPKRPRKKKAA